MAVRGIDGHNGDSFSEFSRGETVPVYVPMVEVDEVTPVDITGYKLYLAYRTKQVCDSLDLPDLEVVISPQLPPEDGIFSGEITDTETFSLPKGTIFVSMRYVDENGNTFVLDKAKHKIYPCINPRLEQ